MIQYHDSEHYNSPLGEDVLRLLLSYLPREDYDKLLYAGDRYVRLNHQPSGNVMAIRSDAHSNWDGAICATPDEKFQEVAEAEDSVSIQG